MMSVFTCREQFFSFAETPQALYKDDDTNLLLCKDPYAIKIYDFPCEWCEKNSLKIGKAITRVQVSRAFARLLMYHVTK